MNFCLAKALGEWLFDSHLEHKATGRFIGGLPERIDKFDPVKSRSLSVTTTQPLDRAMAATIVSKALLERPAAFPCTINSPQMSAAFSSNENMRPAKSARGPSVSPNQVSRAVRFLPPGFSRIPRCISAMVSDANTVFGPRRQCHPRYL